MFESLNGIFNPAHAAHILSEIYETGGSREVIDIEAEEVEE